MYVYVHRFRKCLLFSIHMSLIMCIGKVKIWFTVWKSLGHTHLILSCSSLTETLRWVTLPMLIRQKSYSWRRDVSSIEHPRKRVRLILDSHKDFPPTCLKWEVEGKVSRIDDCRVSSFPFGEVWSFLGFTGLCSLGGPFYWSLIRVSTSIFVKNTSLGFLS